MQNMPYFFISKSCIIIYGLYNLQDQDFSTPEVLARVGQTAALTEEQIAQIQLHMVQQATKDRLRAYTDQALHYGVCSQELLIFHSCVLITF